MTRSLAVSTFLVGALSLAFGTTDAEARHHRRNRCCNTGYVNYGYQNSNCGCQSAPVQACGNGCGTGAWNGSTYNNQGMSPTPNNGYQTAPPPPAESAPAPRT